MSPSTAKHAKSVQPVQMSVCDTPAALEREHGPLWPGLAYAKELQFLWDKGGNPERFVYHGVLAVAVARADKKVAGWGELLVARPQVGEEQSNRSLCRISRLDVAPGFRRRQFSDPRTGKPLSVLLLSSLLSAAPYGAEVVAEVTPDAETLFEEAGFKMWGSGRWLYTGV